MTVKEESNGATDTAAAGGALDTSVEVTAEEMMGGMETDDEDLIFGDALDGSERRIPEAPMTPKGPGGEKRNRQEGEEKEEIQDPLPTMPKQPEVKKTTIASNAAAATDPSAIIKEEEIIITQAATGPTTTTAAAAATRRPPITDGGRSKIIALFACLLMVIILMQGAMIGVLVSRDKDDDENTGRGIDGAGSGTNQAGDAPTSAPTTSSPISTLPPVAAPTLPPVTSASASFDSIQDAPDTELLESVSNCDDCIQTVELPSDFVLSIGATSSSSSPNGSQNNNGDNNGNYNGYNSNNGYYGNNGYYSNNGYNRQYNNGPNNNYNNGYQSYPADQEENNGNLDSSGLSPRAITRAGVSANGYVDLFCSYGGDQDQNQPPQDDEAPCVTIDAIKMDLNPAASGEIYTLVKYFGEPQAIAPLRQQATPIDVIEYWIISWEGVQIFDETDANAVVNVQIIMYAATGVIEICYGSGNVKGNNFRSGVFDYNSNVYHPVEGPDFGPEGFANSFPTNTCHRFFEVEDDNSTDPPDVPPSTVPPGQTQFVQLRNHPGAQDLQMEDGQEYSVDVPFPIFGQDDILVSDDGRIAILGCEDPNYLCALVNIMSVNLDPSQMTPGQGGVFTFHESLNPLEPVAEEDIFPSDAFIVSWENMPVGNSRQARLASGQAHFYPNGSIDACWGNGDDGFTFNAQVTDFVYGSGTHSAQSVFFDEDGQTLGTFPRFTCQTLYDPTETSGPPSSEDGIYPKTFEYISGVLGATRITTVTDCDDCERTLGLDERWPLSWFGSSSEIFSLLVSSNGQIRLGCQEWEVSCGIIDVAFTDLDPSERGGGDVWFLNNMMDNGGIFEPDPETPMYIISWEEVNFYASTSIYVNAQVRFLFDGTIELCWGEGITTGRSIAAGLSDPRYGVSFPATGGPFGTTGVTEPGGWPTNMCQSFSVRGVDISTFPPSSPPAWYPPYPTEPPVWYPTDPPVWYPTYPTQAPVWYPTSPPAAPPSLGGEPLPCVSTIDGFSDCIDDFWLLMRLVMGGIVADNDVVALCGLFEVSETIEVYQRNVTFCCSDGARCGFDFVGGSLIVNGADFTVRDMAFSKGVDDSNLGYGGGNLRISGGGNHRISYCLFDSGYSFGYGGNLLVENAASVWISNCIFDFGVSEIGGGGVAVLNTQNVTVDGCYFNYNIGFEEGGGGLLVINDNANNGRYYNVTVTATRFTNNEGYSGGGVYIQGPNDVFLYNSNHFEYNRAFDRGGAGSIVVFNYAYISGNNGFDNSGGDCDGFQVGNSYCANLWETISASGGYVPTPAPNPGSGSPAYYPTSPPWYYPTSPPWNYETPSLPPSPGGEPQQCVSTIDGFAECISDFWFLFRLVASGIVQDNDVVALCGTLTAEEPLEVFQSNVTLCCEDSSRCEYAPAFEGGGLLSATGTNFTVRDISFYNGAGENGGGNLQITGPGHHKISYCIFSFGITNNYGGNLHVENAESVWISNSIFEFGFSEIGGGGAMIRNTPKVTVEASFFDSNFGGEVGGGGLMIMNDGVGPGRSNNVTILTTSFTNNEAASGGGIYGLGLHNNFTLSSNEFHWNGAYNEGGAGVIFDHAFASLSNNIGYNNDARECSGFRIGFVWNAYCANVWEEIFSVQGVVNQISYVPTTAPHLGNPSSSPVYYPTSPPWYYPTQAPNEPTVDRSCDSSAGICASEFAVLERILRVSSSGDTIAICGEIEIPLQVELTLSDITICCAEGQRCSFTSSGQGNRILVVTGANFNIRGIAFFYGVADGDFGGNLKIDAPGHHTISQCLFDSGLAGINGGNLFVSGGDSITIEDSIFQYGTGLSGTGGASIKTTPIIMIDGSFFDSNRGGREGGGLLIENFDVPSYIRQNITINESYFGYNFADIGGGFMSWGTNSFVWVTNSYFEGNSGIVYGGTAAVLEYSSVYLSGNSGENNFSPDGPCDDIFLTEGDWDNFYCADASETIYFTGSGTNPSNPYPTSPPYWYPTSAPSSFPDAGGLYSKPFTYLSSDPEATKLSSVSECDDCTEVIYLNSSSPVQWFGNLQSPTLGISSNGQIRINGCDVWDPNCGIVNVASADLNPSRRGDVWFKNASSTARDSSSPMYIVSWEDVLFYGSTASFINAQSRFFRNGTIELCWGRGDPNGNTVTAGVYDPRYGISLPVVGGAFGSTGQTQSFQWPDSSCYSFSVSGAVSTLPPTTAPTNWIYYPTSPPWYYEPPTTLPPIPDSGSDRCISTIPGFEDCIDDSWILYRLLYGAIQNGTTIALCGDLTVEVPLEIWQSNVTLCCSGGYRCGMFAMEVQQLVVTGDDFTVQDIAFYSGDALDDAGGNLKIVGGGHHNISYCMFQGGSGLYGGNVFIERADSVYISNSIFELGFSVIGGGGVAIRETPEITIEGSFFDYNSGSSEGGGLMIANIEVDPFGLNNNVSITNTSFAYNGADVGGGFSISGENSYFSVTSSRFEGNRVTSYGGAAAVQSFNYIHLSDHLGFGNDAIECDSFYIDDDGDGVDFSCADLSETITLFRGDEFPVATPTSSPVIEYPTTSPSGYFSEVPSTPSNFDSCAPTAGRCADSFPLLERLVLDASDGDTIAVCGELDSSAQATISSSNITLCCADNTRCSFTSSGERNLLVTGGNITIQGIGFFGGTSGDDDGGNVKIDAPGYHTISQCLFDNGVTTGNGGNLYVGGANGVVISESIFQYGVSTFGSGGLCIENTPVVAISGSSFDFNFGGREGGGILINNENLSTTTLSSYRRIEIKESYFTSNFAGMGGGAMVLAPQSDVSFEASFFRENTGTISGGGAAILAYSSLTILNNDGQDNSSPHNGQCDDFFITNGEWDENIDVDRYCAEIGESISAVVTSTTATTTTTTTTTTLGDP